MTEQEAKVLPFGFHRGNDIEEAQAVIFKDLAEINKKLDDIFTLIKNALDEGREDE